MKRSTPLHAKPAPPRHTALFTPLKRLFQNSKGRAFNLSTREQKWATRAAVVMIAVSLATALL